jgi:hypothetical protein
MPRKGRHILGANVVVAAQAWTRVILHEIDLGR